MAVALLALGALAMGLLLHSLWVLSFTGVPVHPSRPEAVQAAFELLALKDGERFADLGCGFGNVVRQARREADVECTGYELNPFGYLGSFVRAGGRVRVRWGDFRRADLKGYDAIYLYMMPRFLEKNSAWLEGAFREGARVVAIDFPIPGWRPREVREVGPLHQPIRLYVVGQHREEA
jgi:hypothetical protein